MHSITEARKLLSTLWSRERDFLPSHLSPHLKELYGVMGVLNVVFSALMLYEPIYLYTIGFALWQIMLFYAGVYGAYFFLMPLGGIVAKHKGFEHSIMYSSIFLILYLVFLLNIPSQPLFTFLAFLSLALQKTFFWPAYHADFAYFSQSKERGRQMSMGIVLESMASIIGPLLGALVAAQFGFGTLFAGICVVILLSNIPFFLIKERFVPTPFSYREPYRYPVSYTHLTLPTKRIV